MEHLPNHCGNEWGGAAPKKGVVSFRRQSWSVAGPKPDCPSRQEISLGFPNRAGASKWPLGHRPAEVKLIAGVNGSAGFLEGAEPSSRPDDRWLARAATNAATSGRPRTLRHAVIERSKCHRLPSGEPAERLLLATPLLLADVQRPSLIATIDSVGL